MEIYYYLSFSFTQQISFISIKTKFQLQFYNLRLKVKDMDSRVTGIIIAVYGRKNKFKQ